MKRFMPFINNKLVLALLLASTCSASAAYAQEDKEAAVKKMMADKRYTFIAQNVMPLQGPTRQLTSSYDLRITPDSVIAFLPYFGRAYTAPINPADGGIHFTTTNFDYKATNRKKGGWSVSIKPKDFRDVQQLSLIVSETGYATLQVTSTNRQPISFNGYLAEKPQ